MGVFCPHHCCGQFPLKTCNQLSNGLRGSLSILWMDSPDWDNPRTLSHVPGPHTYIGNEQNTIWPHVPGSHIIGNQQKRIRTCKVRAWAKGRLEKISSFLGCLVPSSSSSASSIFTTGQKLLKFSFANDVMWKHVSVGVKHQPGAPCSRQHQLLPRPRVGRLPSSLSFSDSQNSTQYRRSAPA